MKRTFELLAVGGVSALLTIGYLIYVGRVLGPADYAEFSASLAFIYLVATAVSPLSPAIARLAARRTARGETSSVTALRRGILKPLVIALAAGAVVLALPVYGLAYLLKFESALPLLLAFASALGFALLSADRGFLQGLLRFRAYNGSVLIEAIARPAVAVAVFALLKPSATGAMTAYFTAIVVSEIFNAQLFRRGGAMPDVPVDWQELRRLVIPMMALMIAAALYQNLDMIAVKRWFPAVVAGQYGAAAVLAKMFGAIFTPLYVLIGPILTHHFERDEPLVAPALRIGAVFVSLSSIGLVLLVLQGETIVGLLFGAAFTPSAWVAAHLGAVSILIHLSLLLTQVFITVHDFRFLKWFAIAAVVQIAGLAVFHATISEILVVLYVAQLMLIVPLAVRLTEHARAHD